MEVSPTGANKFIVRGFANRQKLMNHWQNGRTHRDEYPEFATAEEYEALRLSFWKCLSAATFWDIKTDMEM